MTQARTTTRPRKNATKSKGISPKFGVRLPADIRALLTRKASALGMSEGAYIRALIADAPVASDTDRAARQETNAHLARIGNNLNQLARHANSWRGNADAAALAKGITTIRADLNRIFAPSSGTGRR